MIFYTGVLAWLLRTVSTYQLYGDRIQGKCKAGTNLLYYTTTLWRSQYFSNSWMRLKSFHHYILRKLFHSMSLDLKLKFLLEFFDR